MVPKGTADGSGLLEERTRSALPRRPPASKFDLKSFLASMDFLPQAILVLDAGNNIVAANPAMEALLGKDSAGFRNKKCWEFVHGSDAAGRPAECPCSPMRCTGKNETVELPIESTGSWAVAGCTPIYDRQGELEYIIHAFTDISERRRVETELAGCLAEKDLLLKEVHHRTKNNMITVLSLISLQAHSTCNGEAAAVLKAAEDRMKGLVLLYERLSKSETYHELPVAEYLSPLIDQIAAAFPESAFVRVEKSLGDFVLDVKTLQLLGIIVNELLTNTMKHAFLGRDRGTISVSATRIGSRNRITVRDDGNGLPETEDPSYSEGFGLFLVSGLVDQLKGSLRIERENGTAFVLEF